MRTWSRTSLRSVRRSAQQRHSCPARDDELLSKKRVLGEPVRRSLSGSKVAAILDGVAKQRGHASQITVDNGTEFYSKAMDH